eukprot:TRINITY_DN65833_c0_g1_i1.p1 TRINITY_DN65833_c0_g1~~TRINITY_DN65833_c0_g1_i1.p1  ORF type:complete len:1095 (+),score=66.28 TRINITY_DN65833_c0_g1_i1:361-3285(+)
MAAVRSFMAGVYLNVSKTSLPKINKWVAFDRLSIFQIGVDEILSSVNGPELSFEFIGVRASVAGGISVAGKTVEFRATLKNSVMKVGLRTEHSAEHGRTDRIALTRCHFMPDIEKESFELSAVVQVVGSGISGKLVIDAIKSLLRLKTCPQAVVMMDTMSKAFLSNMTSRMQSSLAEFRLKRKTLNRLDGYLSMRRVPIFGWLDDFIAHDVGASGISAIANLVLCRLANKHLANKVEHYSAALPGVEETEKPGRIEATFSNIHIAGCSSISDVRMPDLDGTRDPMSLGVASEFRSLSAKLDVSALVRPPPSLGPVTVAIDASIRVGFVNLRMLIRMVFVMLQNRIPSLQMPMPSMPACLLPALRDAQIGEIEVQFSSSSVVISPVAKPRGDCEGVNLVGNIVSWSATEFNSLANDLANFILKTEVSKLGDDVLHKMIDTARQTLLTEKQTEDLLLDTDVHPSPFCSGAESHLSIVFRNLFICVGVGSIVLAMLSYQVFSPLLTNVRVTSRLPWKCLAAHQHVHATLVFVVPCAIAAKCILQLWAYTKILAVLQVTLDRPGDRLVLPPLDKFSLQGTILKFMENDKRFEALVTAMMSGCYPLAKLVLLFMAWLLPTKVLPVHVRGRLLFAVNTLGKLSFLEMFTLVITAMSRHMEFSVGSSSILVSVRPVEGYFMTCLVVVFTNCLSNLLAKLHAEIVAIDSRLSSFAGTSRHSTLAEIAKDASADPSQVISRPCLALVIVLLSSSVCFLCVGLQRPLYSVHTRGLVGTLMGSKAASEYAFGSFIARLPYACGGSFNDFTIWSIASMLVLLVVAMEVVHSVALLLAFCAPAHSRIWRALVNFVQTLAGWACLDVFLMALFNYYMNNQSLTQLMIGNKCDALNDVLAESFSDVVTDPVCMSSVVALQEGFWCLVASVLLSRSIFLLLRVHVPPSQAISHRTRSCSSISRKSSAHCSVDPFAGQTGVELKTISSEGL